MNSGIIEPDKEKEDKASSIEKADNFCKNFKKTSINENLSAKSNHSDLENLRDQPLRVSPTNGEKYFLEDLENSDNEQKSLSSRETCLKKTSPFFKHSNFKEILRTEFFSDEEDSDFECSSDSQKISSTSNEKTESEYSSNSDSSPKHNDCPNETPNESPRQSRRRLNIANNQFQIVTASSGAHSKEYDQLETLPEDLVARKRCKFSNQNLNKSLFDSNCHYLKSGVMGDSQQISELISQKIYQENPIETEESITQKCRYKNDEEDDEEDDEEEEEEEEEEDEEDNSEQLDALLDKRSVKADEEKKNGHSTNPEIGTPSPDRKKLKGEEESISGGNSVGRVQLGLLSSTPASDETIVDTSAKSQNAVNFIERMPAKYPPSNDAKQLNKFMKNNDALKPSHRLPTLENPGYYNSPTAPDEDDEYNEFSKFYSEIDQNFGHPKTKSMSNVPDNLKHFIKPNTIVSEKQRMMLLSKQLQSTDYSNCKNLPYPRNNEIEFIIEDFLSIRCTGSSPAKLYSQTKTFNSVTFRILLFPKGNLGDRITTSLRDLSAYVAVDPSASLPPQFESKWCLQRCDYQLIVINWKNWREKSILKNEQYTFTSDDPDRGWRDLVPSEGLKIGEFLGPSGQLIIRAQIVPKSVDASNHSFQGRQESNYIGIKNQGATCYLNSLVQALFHIGQFRKNVFELTLESDRQFLKDLEKQNASQQTKKTTSKSLVNNQNEENQIFSDLNREQELQQFFGETDDETNTFMRWDSDELKQAFESENTHRANGGLSNGRGVSLALQSLFLKMMTSNEVVTTDDLIKSFGWQSNESLTQHDAQELNRLLCDRLEEQMKGTPAEGSIESLFMGEFENYVECLDVPYGSSRREKFYDLQLDVQDTKDMYDSLLKYTAEEILEGDNLYDAEQFGKQRAKKGVRFIRFPPVIQFHLKRFTFDPTRMDMIKINERFEYPEKLDLSRVLPGAGMYELFCVIVHAGDVGGGHYYVINRPGGKAWWYKFDDEKVYPVTSHSALNDSYGGYDALCWDYLQHLDDASYKPQSVLPKLYSAYILFYVKVDLSAEILAEPDPDVVNPYLVQRLLYEEEQKKKRIQIQRFVQRYVTVRYITECSLQGCKEFLNDLHTLPACHEQRFANDMPIFTLWKTIDTALQNQEIQDVLLKETRNDYFFGLWYFDGTYPNRVTGRIADVRPLPCHLGETTRRHFTVGEHFSWIAKTLKCSWKPTLPVLIHPLFIRQRTKIRSVPTLASSILEMRIFIAKVFSPGKHSVRPSEKQTLTTLALPCLKYEKDRRIAPGPSLIAELAQSLKNYQLSYLLEKFDDDDIKEFIKQIYSLPETFLQLKTTTLESFGIVSCYLEEGGSFEPLPTSGAALAERLEISRHSRVEDPCPIIVFSLPPSLEAARLKAFAETYATSNLEIDFEDDCSSVEVLEEINNKTTYMEKYREDSLTSSVWPSETALVSTKVPDNTTEESSFEKSNVITKFQKQNTLLSGFDGNFTPVPIRRPFPPKTPQFISCTPIDWHRSLTRSKISVTLKLYDPLVALGRWEDAGGHPVSSSCQPLSEELKCSLSASNLTYDSATASIENVYGEASHQELNDTKIHTTRRDQTQLSRCPPISKRSIEIDLRWPYALAIRRLCWFLGQHEESCLIMSAPPLSGDALAFSHCHFPPVYSEEHYSIDNNSGISQCSTPDASLVYRLNELHALLAQKQGHLHYRDITLPPTEIFLSEVQYHFSLLPRPVTSSLFGWKSSLKTNERRDNTQRVLLVRIFNSKVESVGCVLVEVDLDLPPTVQEFIEAAQLKYTDEMLSRGAPTSQVKCRLAWIGSYMGSVEAGACHQWSPIPNFLEILGDSSFRVRFASLTRGFQFDTPLRIEPDFSETELENLKISESLQPLISYTNSSHPNSQKRTLKVLVLHQNRERQYFGHPFFIVLSSTDTLKLIKEKIHAKLELSLSTFSKWKLFLFDFEHTCFVRDDEIPNFGTERTPCILAVHRNIYAAESRSRMLQLHIQ